MNTTEIFPYILNEVGTPNSLKLTSSVNINENPHQVFCSKFSNSLKDTFSLKFSLNSASHLKNSSLS